MSPWRPLPKSLAPTTGSSPTRSTTRSSPSRGAGISRRGSTPPASMRTRDPCRPLPASAPTVRGCPRPPASSPPTTSPLCAIMRSGSSMPQRRRWRSEPVQAAAAHRRHPRRGGRPPDAARLRRRPDLDPRGRRLLCPGVLPPRPHAADRYAARCRVRGLVGQRGRPRRDARPRVLRRRTGPRCDHRHRAHHHRRRPRRGRKSRRIRDSGDGGERMSWLWLSLSILSEVAGTLCLRASAGLQRRIWFIPVAISYTAAFIFLGRTLAAGMPLGVAYGLWAACGVALVCLLSRVIWKDPLTRRALIGIGLIVIGVVLVETG